jgi:hypothetical protein
MSERTRWTLKPQVLPSATPELPDAVVTIAYGPVPSLPVEVVPVPDEQAIERAARKLCDIWPTTWDWPASLAVARDVLAAALEQPE